jgi:hypothetical protein
MSKIGLLHARPYYQERPAKYSLPRFSTTTEEECHIDQIGRRSYPSHRNTYNYVVSADKPNQQFYNTASDT